MIKGSYSSLRLDQFYSKRLITFLQAIVVRNKVILALVSFAVINEGSSQWISATPSEIKEKLNKQLFLQIFIFPVAIVINVMFNL